MEERDDRAAQTRRMQLIAVGVVAGVIVLFLLTNLTIALLLSFPAFMFLAWLWYGRRLEAARQEDRPQDAGTGSDDA